MKGAHGFIDELRKARLLGESEKGMADGEGLYIVCTLCTDAKRDP